MQRTVTSKAEGTEAHWFALYIRSRFEKKVDLRLRERGIMTFLPLIEEIHVWSDRKQRVLEPLFRGYLFVRTDLRDRLAILDTDGVVRFVGVRFRPSAISDVEIESIKIAGSEPSKIKREPYVSAGEKVRVSDGPFEGVEGFVMAVKGSLRVIVSIDCIGQSVSVEVSPEWLTKLR